MAPKDIQVPNAWKPVNVTLYSNKGFADVDIGY